MIVAGQTVENPVTGERLTFHATARETGGEYVSFEALITPGGTLASAHLHPYQTERFELVSGTLTMRVGARKFEAKAGDVAFTLFSVMAVELWWERLDAHPPASERHARTQGLTVH